MPKARARIANELVYGLAEVYSASACEDEAMVYGL